MKMTHIYQPLMIRTLLSSDNTATVEDIARAFVNSDPSQLEYYKQIAKRWPHITLRKHNVIKYDKGVYTLLAENITRSTKAFSSTDFPPRQLYDQFAWDICMLHIFPLSLRNVSHALKCFFRPSRVQVLWPDSCR